MLELLGAFSIGQIITWIVLLALSVKGVSGYVDWIRKKYKQKFNKDYNKKEKERKQKETDEIFDKEIKESKTYYLELNNKINDLTILINNKLNTINIAMTHDIKQWIIGKHKYYMGQGWIDVNDLDMIETRYDDYKSLGGNSIIPTLVAELRKLPKHSRKE